MNRRRAKIPVPKEHGAWFLLYGSVLLVILAYGWAGYKMLLFLAGLTGAFLAHEPLSRLARLKAGRPKPSNARLWRRWLLIYALAAAIAGAALLSLYRLWGLLPLAGAASALFIVHLILVRRREERRVAGEVVGIAGLTAASPAAYYVIAGRLDSTAVLIWAVNLIYFSSAIFYVKMRVSRFSRVEDHDLRRRQCVGYHVFVSAGAMALWAVGLVGATALLAYIPIVARAFWGAVRPGQALSLKRIGYAEIGYTAVYVAMMALALP